MIKNVNLLQNPIEYDKYIEEYLIQALANLGQRIGIKGDGISYHYFTFGDLLGDSMSYYNTPRLGYIQYTKSTNSDKYTAVFGVCKYDPQTGMTYGHSDGKLSESLDINDVLYFPNDLSFDITLGGIEKYAKNSICINDGNDLTFMLVGKLIGTNDDEDLNSVLYYYKFDINSNLLKFGAKIYYDSSDDNGDWFHLMTVVNKTYKGNNYKDNSLSDEYEMSFHIFNAKTLQELDNASQTTDHKYYNSFLSSFKFSNYKSSNEIPFSLIRAEYNDINELLSYSDEESYHFSTNSPIALILNYLPNSLYDTSKIDLIYNSNKNEFFTIDSDKFENIVSMFNAEYGINLNEDIYQLNEDCNNLYYNIFSYYNEKYYLETRVGFIKRILSKLYERISDYNYAKETFLYIPLDYQFHYICNSNDSMYIYYSTNTYVTFVNLNSINTSNFWDNNTNLIFDYDNDISKVKTYNFEINYNRNNEKLINSVVIKDIFTMPYINANSNWSINDTDTKIQAVGKDAGNPNIILIYNKDKQELGLDKSFYLLNAISNSKEIKGATYNKIPFNINPALFENTYTINIQGYAYIPEITKNNFEYFKNSIIVSISDLECLSDTTYKIYYKGSYILTMWHLTEVSNNKYEFKCINHIDTNYALALGSTVNLINATSDESVENLNDQDLILLKAIITELGQQRLSINENNWMIIKNKQSEEYTAFNDNVGQYLNDLNGVVQYNDTVKLNNNHIQHSQTNKYISSLNNLKTTNSIYPKYYKSQTTVSTTKSEIIKELRNIGTLIGSQRISKVYVDGATVQNVESLIQSIEKNYAEQEKIIEHTIQIEQVEKSQYNYNEFVFNENVPSLDFGEVFNRNFNVLNRVNVVSLDTNGKIYNAYIGTSYDEQSKATLHIGTTNTNINVGSETLIDDLEKTNFNTHNNISIDFDNIILNASKQLIAKQNILYQPTINGVTYNIMSMPLIGMCSSLYTTSLFSAENIKLLSSDLNEIPELSNYKLSLYNLFRTCFGINLPDSSNNISLNIYNIKDVLYNNLNVRNDNPEFNENMYYVVSQNNNVDRIHILFKNELIQTTNIVNNNVIYTGFNLNIMYYISYDESTETNKYNIYLSIN